MPLTHTHYCQHCDRTLSCPLGDDCVLLGATLRTGTTRRFAARKSQGKIRSLAPSISDISHLHKCDEAIRYREAIRNATRDNSRGCRYGCSRLPCLHGATIRFPRVGASVPHAAEIFERNPPSAIGDAIRRHGLYSKPDGRRLREWADQQRESFARCINPPADGNRANCSNDAATAERDQNHAPTLETLAIANVERNATDSDATANAKIAIPTANAANESNT